MRRFRSSDGRIHSFMLSRQTETDTETEAERERGREGERERERERKPPVVQTYFPPLIETHDDGNVCQ